MKAVIKKFVPRSARKWYSDQRRLQVARREYRLDRRRYMRSAAPPDSAVAYGVRGRQLETQLTKDYHRIEKGLALAAPKPRFGAAVSQRIESLLPVARREELVGAHVGYAEDAHAALTGWNTRAVRADVVSPVGADLTRHELTNDEVTRFFESRRSIRDFDASRRVPREVLLHAATLAGHTPSVCNRQSWTAHFFDDAEQVRRVLAFQNGNRGFTEQVPCVAVITVDSRLFAGVEERNQPFIEGGLFAMSLVHALHGLGLGTCMLNMSVRNGRADRLRREVGLGEHDQVIMMVAIGYPSPGFRVARSPRRALDEIAVIH